MEHRGNIWKKGLAVCLMVMILAGFMPLVTNAGTMYDD